MITSRRQFVKTASALAAAAALPTVLLAGERIDPVTAWFNKMVQKEAKHQELRLFPEVDMSITEHLYTAFVIQADIMERDDREDYITKLYIRPGLMSMIRGADNCTQLRVTRDPGLVVETSRDLPWMNPIPEDSIPVLIRLYAHPNQLVA